MKFDEIVDFSESMGIGVSCESMEDDKVGKIVVDDHGVPLIVLNDKSGAGENEKTFAVAHMIGHIELGHLEEDASRRLGKVVNGEMPEYRSNLYVDRRYVDIMEWTATEYAIKLLVPEKILEEAMELKLSEIIDFVKKETGVDDRVALEAITGFIREKASKKG